VRALFVVTSVLQTAWRGMRLCCPSCGARTLFDGYLKLAPVCQVCGADFSRSGTADVAPYITVFIIGLIATPSTLVLTMRFGVTSSWALAAFLAGALAATLVLLPRVKGALAALLWRARREI
jgi:uncharacterized protein (DUF983 family)